MSQIGFMGLGTMGRPMVRRLVAAGHEVKVWNRSAGPVAGAVADGAIAADGVEDVFACSTVLSILADDRSVTERILESGVLDSASCRVHVNLATVSASLAAEATAAHAEAGIGYVGAPVLGRAEVAEAGMLNVLVAGDPRHVEQARPALEPLAAKLWELGPDPAQANVVKIAVNFLLGSAIEATAEGVALVQSYGVSPHTFIDLISNSLFPGPVYKTYGGLMSDRRYEPPGFTTRLGLKDMRLALSAAHGRDLPLPTASLVQDALIEAIAAGWSESDWAVLGELARRRAGLDGQKPRSDD